MMLFVMLYKVAQTFMSVDEILKCGDSEKAIEQYFPVILYVCLLLFFPLIFRDKWKKGSF